MPVRRASDYGTAICLGVILYVEGILALTLFNLVLIGYCRLDVPLRRTSDYGTAICLGVILKKRVKRRYGIVLKRKKKWKSPSSPKWKPPRSGFMVGSGSHVGRAENHARSWSHDLALYRTTCVLIAILTAAGRNGKLALYTGIAQREMSGPVEVTTGVSIDSKTGKITITTGASQKS